VSSGIVRGRDASRIILCPPCTTSHAARCTAPYGPLLRCARRCDGLVAASVEEHGNPAADTVLAQAHREALVRHADDDEANAGQALATESTALAPRGSYG